MLYEYNAPPDYPEEEIRAVIHESLASRLAFARRRLAAYQESCETFEKRYGMSTQEFLEKFEAGVLGDQQEWFDWYAVAEGKALWRRKYDLLTHLT